MTLLSTSSCLRLWTERQPSLVRKLRAIKSEIIFGMFSFDLEEVLVVVDNSAESSSPMAADEAMNETYRNWNPRFNFRCNWGNRGDFKGGEDALWKKWRRKSWQYPDCTRTNRKVETNRLEVDFGKMRDFFFYIFVVYFFQFHSKKSSFLINTKSCSLLLNIQYTISTKTLTDHFPKEWSLLFKHKHINSYKQGKHTRQRWTICHNRLREGSSFTRKTRAFLPSRTMIGRQKKVEKPVLAWTGGGKKNRLSFYSRLTLV